MKPIHVHKNLERSKANLNRRKTSALVSSSVLVSNIFVLPLKKEKFLKIQAFVIFMHLVKL